MAQSNEAVVDAIRVWYNTEGPFSAVYQMVPESTLKLDESNYRVKFRVSPETGFLYSRRYGCFHTHTHTHTQRTHYHLLLVRFTVNVKGSSILVEGWVAEEQFPDEGTIVC